MVCLSYNGMIAQMKHLAKGFDSDILARSERLASNLQVCMYYACMTKVNLICNREMSEEEKSKYHGPECAILQIC